VMWCLASPCFLFLWSACPFYLSSFDNTGHSFR
jgi:hypothetical protein